MFKNATTYTLQKSISEVFGLSFELDEKLAEFSHRPIESNEAETLGWVPVIPGSKDLVHTIGADMVLRVRRDTKVIPNDAVQSELQDKVDEISETYGRMVTKNERTELKEQIIQKHLPTAPVKTKFHYVLIMQTEFPAPFVVVDTSSDKVADEVTSYLRKCIGSLPVQTLSCEKQPTNVFHSWMTDSNFDSLGNECVLIDAEGKGRITFAKQEDLISSTEEHLAEGMVIKQINVANEHRSLVVNDNLVIKKIKYNDDYIDHCYDQTNDLQSHEADHFVNRMNIFLMLKWLILSMGGLAKLDLGEA